MKEKKRGGREKREKVVSDGLSSRTFVRKEEKGKRGKREVEGHSHFILLLAGPLRGKKGRGEGKKREFIVVSDTSYSSHANCAQEEKEKKKRQP